MSEDRDRLELDPSREVLAVVNPDTGETLAWIGVIVTGPRRLTLAVERAAGVEMTIREFAEEDEEATG